MKRTMVGLVFLTMAANAFAYYNPGQGRWTSRDPINEQPENRRSGQPNVGNGLEYVFVNNAPINKYDMVGLLTIDSNCTPTQAGQLQSEFYSFCDYVRKNRTSFGCCVNRVTIPERLLWMCDNHNQITITCEQSNSGSCKDACAWSLPGGSTIHMCPPGLQPDPRCGPFGCTLLHEMTHMIGHIGERIPNKVENCLGPLGCPKRNLGWF